MYTNTVRLPYTLWYDGHDKIFRMDMSTILPEEHYEDGKKYIGKIRNVHYEVAYYADNIYPRPLLTIPFSSLREVTSGSNTFDSNNLDQMLTVLSSATNGALDSLASYILNGRDFQLVKNGGNLTFKWRDTGGNDHNLLQFRYEDVVDKQVINTFIREETKDFYTKAEVDSLIQQLKHELMSEEHPQQ